MMVKIVYFDEGSATDYIHIVEGGKAENKTEKIEDKTTKMTAKADARIDAKFKWIPFLGASAGTEVSGDVAKLGNTIIRKAISNTILTDYLSKANEETDKEKIITTFRNCTIMPYPNSLAYYKMITPYLIMTEGKVEVEEGFALNIARMDEALESARGYYELIIDDCGVKSVLRFNIKAFRNNYGIADLIKMKLTYQAIEVGEISEVSLNMQHEFTGQQKTLTGLDIINESEELNLKVYDVILAGVDK